MANITKQVDRGVPENYRSQVFTESDAGSGDIIMVFDSLGKRAKTVHIQNDGGTMTVKFNVLRTIYPALPYAGGAIQNPRLDLTNAQEVEDESMAVLTIDPNETFSLDDDMAVQDIKIVSASGSYEIFVA